MGAAGSAAVCGIVREEEDCCFRLLNCETAELISFLTKEARLHSGGAMWTLYIRLPKMKDTTAKSLTQMMTDLTKKLVCGSAPKMTKIGTPTTKICKFDTIAKVR